jgi:hypothetical protein
MKTALLTSILAQGTPLLAAADVSSPEMVRFVGSALRARTQLAGLMQPPSFEAVRELIWFNELGSAPSWDETNPVDGVLGVCIRQGGVLGKAACLILSCSWHTITLRLPPTSGTSVWHVLLDSGSPAPDDIAIDEGGRPLSAGSTYDLAPKAALLLSAVPRRSAVLSTSNPRSGAASSMAGVVAKRSSEFGAPFSHASQLRKVQEERGEGSRMQSSVQERGEHVRSTGRVGQGATGQRQGMRPDDVGDREATLANKSVRGLSGRPFLYRYLSEQSSGASASQASESTRPGDGELAAADDQCEHRSSIFQALQTEEKQTIGFLKGVSDVLASRG